MASRKQCVVEILSSHSVIIESEENPLAAYINESTTNGVLIIKKEMRRRVHKLKHPPDGYQNKVWEFPCVLICESETLLDSKFDSIETDLNAYTNSPTSTATNSITYKRAEIVEGEQDSTIGRYVMDLTIYLLEQFVAVAVA